LTAVRAPTFSIASYFASVIGSPLEMKVTPSSDASIAAAAMAMRAEFEAAVRTHVRRPRDRLSTIHLTITATPSSVTVSGRANPGPVRAATAETS
jgi:hypothetical protein